MSASSFFAFIYLGLDQTGNVKTSMDFGASGCVYNRRGTFSMYVWQDVPGL